MVRAILFPVLFAALALGAVEGLGLWTRIAASHPWWSTSAVGIGIAGGAVLATALLFGSARNLLAPQTLGALALVAVAVAAGAAWYGRSVFVGAEDFVVWAGRLWHYGFIALNGMLTLFISVVFASLFDGGTRRTRR